MKVQATYNAPPQPEGTVALVMPEGIAARLLALVSRCNGDGPTALDPEHAIYTSLQAAVPNRAKLKLVDRGSGHPPLIDLHNKYDFVRA